MLKELSVSFAFLLGERPNVEQYQLVDVPPDSTEEVQSHLADRAEFEAMTGIIREPLLAKETKLPKLRDLFLSVLSLEHQTSTSSLKYISNVIHRA